MKLRVLALPALAAALCAGCSLKALFRRDKPREVVRRDANGIDAYYDIRYPLRAGRPYEYKTYEQHTFTEIGGDYDPAVSPDGSTLIFASTYHSKVPEIYMKTMHGATITRLTNSQEAEIQPCFNHNGTKFAYATNRRGSWDICYKSVNGKNVTPVTRGMTDDISPCWHPGGAWIAFSSYSPRNGQWQIAVKNVDTGQLKYLGEGLYPKFSPDGSKIAFQRARQREPRWYSIWVADLDGDFNIKTVTEVVSSPKWAAINPNWSPDGNYLVFATVHESPLAQGSKRILMGDDIWIVNRHGQDLIKLTDTPAPESHPVWARDAKDKNKERIYFLSMKKGPKNVWSVVPRLPELYGEIRGRVPGPPAERTPPPARGTKGPGARRDRPGELETYLSPPPPATSGGTRD
jgi:Tol biopolymer transport system component